MTVGTPWKLIIAFAVPLLLGNCFQQVYNLVDTIVVGKGISDSALAAVGSTGSLHFFVFGFVTGLTNGASIPMAQAYGAKDERRLQKVIAMGLVTCLSIGILFSVLSVAGSTLLLNLLQTPEDIFTDARTYMNIIFGCLFVTVCYNFSSCLLRALGDSKTPLTAIVISSMINVVLDIVFVIWFHWGVAGAAWATVIAQVCSVIFCIWKLVKIPIIRPKQEDWKLDFKLIGSLIKLGVPVGFMNSITAVGGMILQYFVNGMGSIYTASYSACSKMFMFFEQPGSAIGLAMATYVGQNYGAKQFARIRQGVRSGCVIALIVSVALGSLEIFFCDQLVGIMLSDTETIKLCRLMLPYGGAFLWSLGLLFVFRQTSIAMGHTMIPMTSGILELAMRAILSLLLVNPLGYIGVTFSEISAWVAAAALLFVNYVLIMRNIEKQKRKVRI